MPIIPEVQERLRSLLPAEFDVDIVRAVREGVLIADSCFDQGMLLADEMGLDLKGHVRRVGIAHQLCEYSRRGALDLNVQMTRMPRGHWHWLEIRRAGLLAHMCRTDDIHRFPEEAESRQDPRLSIQGDLLSWAVRDKSMSQIIREIPELYAWLTYRVAADGSVSHICWCSPAPDENTYIAQINLLEEAKRSRELPPEPAHPSPKDMLRFQDAVQQLLERDKDSTKNQAE
jgi:hypothetical protein